MTTTRNPAAAQTSGSGNILFRAGPQLRDRINAACKDQAVNQDTFIRAAVHAMLERTEAGLVLPVPKRRRPAGPDAQTDTTSVPRGAVGGFADILAEDAAAQRRGPCGGVYND